MPAYTNINGVWRTVTRGTSNIGGTWRSSNAPYVNVNGVWRSAALEQKIKVVSQANVSELSVSDNYVRVMMTGSTVSDITASFYMMLTPFTRRISAGDEMSVVVQRGGSARASGSYGFGAYGSDYSYLNGGTRTFGIGSNINSRQYTTLGTAAAEQYGNIGLAVNISFPKIPSNDVAAYFLVSFSGFTINGQGFKFSL
ncbi:hypothetical protein LJC63_06390 [Ruminococcaceae bacterium OttesenSCG-928-L11]|nr:hypothetical protein [Ruminococcaceae bacterium OttesenSCG-928-L11]